MNTIDLISDPDQISHQNLTGAHMATYKELIAQKAKLEEQIETARAKELEAVIQQVRQTVAEYGLTAEDLGLAQRRGRRAGAKAPVPAKYRDPKTGATWSGRGRAPAWIGKNRDKFLIA
ncbi:DNA-binding protein H-NS [Ralstonia pickettii]